MTQNVETKAKATETKTFFAVSLIKEHNGAKPGLYAGADADGVHRFLTDNATEDTERNLKVDLVEDKAAAEKKLEKVQELLFGFPLGLSEVTVEVEVEVKAGN